MKLLFTGNGKSGSYRMRAEQLGAAMGADVKPKAHQGDYDLVVGVKRGFEPRYLKRWVYDIVDAYPQPQSYAWNRDQAIKWIRGHISQLKPNAVIWPTHKMREDCDTGLPGIVLPHHCRKMTPSPGEGRVGYEGGAHYLGKWRPAIEAECAKRGWTFEVNPQHYERLSVVVAVRDGGGYVCREWKSGVKKANAIAIGAKFISQRECGYTENLVGGEGWVEEIEDLPKAFDTAQPIKANSFTVEQAAALLKPWLYAL